MKLPSLARMIRGEGRTPASSHPDSWTDGPTDDAALVDLLAKYAADSLSPDRAALSRGRDAMLAALQATPMTARTDAGDAMAAVPGRRLSRQPVTVPFGRSIGSRRAKLLAGMAAVAILLVAAVGVAAESGPGQPFYRLRLSVEAVALPPAGSTARTQADLGRAQARLDEIEGTSRGGDWKAAADAAEAYDQVVASMAAPAEGAAGAAYRAQLEDQLAHLLSLRAHSQGDESQALDRAIARLEALLGKGPQASPSPSPTPCATPAHGHQGSDGNGNGNGNGNGRGNGADGSGAPVQSAPPSAAPPGADNSGAADCDVSPTPVPVATEGPHGNGSGGPGDSGSDGSGGRPGNASPNPSHTPHGNGGDQPDATATATATATASNDGHRGPPTPAPSSTPDP